MKILFVLTMLLAGPTMACEHHSKVTTLDWEKANESPQSVVFRILDQMYMSASEDDLKSGRLSRSKNDEGHVVVTLKDESSYVTCKSGTVGMLMVQAYTCSFGGNYSKPEMSVESVQGTLYAELRDIYYLQDTVEAPNYVNAVKNGFEVSNDGDRLVCTASTGETLPPIEAGDSSCCEGQDSCSHEDGESCCCGSNDGACSEGEISKHGCESQSGNCGGAISLPAVLSHSCEVVAKSTDI